MPGSFVDKLRMNNIYPSGPDSNPFGSPDLSAGGINPQLIGQLMQQAQGFQQTGQDRQWRREDNVYARNRADRLSDIGSQINQSPPQQPQMNTVFRQDPTQLTAFQKGSLEQDKNELAQKSAYQSGMLKEKTNVDTAKLKNIDEDQLVRQQRANAYDFKSRNPNHKFIMSNDGTIHAINPLTNEDTPIPTGGMSAREKQELIGNQRSDLLSQKADQDLNMQGVKGDQNLANIAARTSGQQSINEAKPIKEELPTQTKVRNSNAAQGLINSRPDLALFIQKSPDGFYQITPPSQPNGFQKYFNMSPSGPSQTQFDEINKLLSSPNQSEPTKTTTKPVTKKPEVKSKYKVTVE